MEEIDIPDLTPSYPTSSPPSSSIAIKKIDQPSVPFPTQRPETDKPTETNIEEIPIPDPIPPPAQDSPSDNIQAPEDKKKKSFLGRMKEKVVVYFRKLTLADIRFIEEEE